MTTTWTSMIVDQLGFYLQAHLFPRLEGLTDDEYFWEPVPDCWSVRSDGAGGWTLDEGTPDGAERITTIAWRIVHVGVSNLGTRANAYFGPQAGDDVDMFDGRYVEPIPGTAADAVAQLTGAWARWRDGIAALDDDQLATPLGPKGGPFAADPLAALVLHVSRETMHHGGEIGLLRDLYRENVTAQRRETSSSPAERAS
jgi:hypothetical protein